MKRENEGNVGNNEDNGTKKRGAACSSVSRRRQMSSDLILS